MPDGLHFQCWVLTHRSDAYSCTRNNSASSNHFCSGGSQHITRHISLSSLFSSCPKLSCSNNPLLWTAHLARKGSAHLARKGNLKQKIFHWKQGDIPSKGTIANYFLEIVFSVMMGINIYYTYVVLNPELCSCVGRPSCLSCYFRKSETGTIFIYERENWGQASSKVYFRWFSY